jgi:two-component system cell cycle response regulator CtrA
MTISIKEYFALTGSSFSNDDARAIGPVLQEIATDGDVTAEAVVQAAHSANSPLRGYFEWDDKKAAHQYRVGQANHMINAVRVRFVSEGKEYATRAYRVAVKQHEGDAAGWDEDERSIEIVRSPNDEILAALREVDAWRVKYSHLAAFQNAKSFLVPIFNQVAEFRADLADAAPIPINGALGELVEWVQKYSNEEAVSASALLGEHIKYMAEAINESWESFGRFKHDPALRRSLVEEENEELRERVRMLEETMNGKELLPPELKLTASEERVVSALLSRDIMSKEAILTALYSDRADDAPEIKIVDVFVCKIRAKIEPHGLQIETHWGRGYSMSPESKQELRGMIAARKEAAA